ncbi:MAG TPA: M1 family metallopeptidase [Isosphaeraceae bacterium]
MNRKPTRSKAIPSRVPLGCLALVLAAAATAPADTYPRQLGVDVQHYAFKLALSDESDAIDAEATVAVRFPAEGMGTVTLDLASADRGKGMTVASVASAGKDLKFEHKSHRLVIPVDPVAKPGETHEFLIKYGGIPASGLRIGKNKFGERTFFSENWPDKARQWLPTVDHPYDKATSEFVVTAPARYQVVANGLLVEEIDLGDGRRTTHWKESVPIATWLNALGVAQFASRHSGSVRGVPVEVWSYHQEADLGRTAFEGPALKALEYYMETFGPFSYEKLGNVEAAGVDGGMEHASAIFYGERSVRGRPETDLVAHEVAHQWFGDAVTESDWDDVWLSEGFATYGALLFAEHDRGREAFVAGLKRARRLVLDFEAKNPGVAVIHANLADMNKVLNPLVYQKGAWMLHMLRRRVGDEKFFAGLRLYYRRHRDGNASTDDFRHAMEEASGRSLGRFFGQWLRRPGSPIVRGTWHYDAERKAVVIELKVQDPPGASDELPMEIGIGIEGRDGLRIEEVVLTRPSQTFTRGTDAPVTSVVLDPNTWLLMDGRIERR